MRHLLADVRDRVDELQTEVDQLENGAAVAQQRINAKASEFIVNHIREQAEKIHELSGHVGSLIGCFQADCVESKRLESAIRDAAKSSPY